MKYDMILKELLFSSVLLTLLQILTPEVTLIRDQVWSTLIHRTLEQVNKVYYTEQKSKTFVDNVQVILISALSSMVDVG